MAIAEMDEWMSDFNCRQQVVDRMSGAEDIRPATRLFTSGAFPPNKYVSSSFFRSYPLSTS